MADVSTYMRCTGTHFWNGTMYHVGDIRQASDPAVAQNPSLWVALTDATLVNEEIVE